MVRGGIQRDAAIILEGLSLVVSVGKPAVLSVFAMAPSSGQGRDACTLAVCREAGLKNGQVQVSSAGRLRAAGFELADERSENESWCHYHVYFQAPVQQSTVRSWVDCFDDPIPNPGRGGSD